MRRTLARFRSRYAAPVILWLNAIVWGILISMLCGCTRTVYVPTESVKKEYIKADTTALTQLIDYLREKIRSRERTIDSLMQSVSERLVLNDRGDTLRHDRERIVYSSSYREKELEKEIEKRDSLIRDMRARLDSVKADSVQVPYPVEAKLTRWQRAKMSLGGVAMGVLFIALCAAVMWLARKRKLRI